MADVLTAVNRANINVSPDRHLWRDSISMSGTAEQTLHHYYHRSNYNCINQRTISFYSQRITVQDNEMSVVRLNLYNSQSWAHD